MESKCMHESYIFHTFYNCFACVHGVLVIPDVGNILATFAPFVLNFIEQAALVQSRM